MPSFVICCTKLFNLRKLFTYTFHFTSSLRRTSSFSTICLCHSNVSFIWIFKFFFLLYQLFLFWLSFFDNFLPWTLAFCSIRLLKHVFFLLIIFVWWFSMNLIMVKSLIRNIVIWWCISHHRIDWGVSFFIINLLFSVF